MYYGSDNMSNAILRVYLRAANPACHGRKFHSTGKSGFLVSAKVYGELITGRIGRGKSDSPTALIGEQSA